MCREHAADYQRQRSFELREAVRQFKLRSGCADCGYCEHHAGLEFDHRDGEVKAGNVAKLSLQGNKTATWAEIAKCDVVCGTCHNIRTWTRRQPIGEVA